MELGTSDGTAEASANATEKATVATAKGSEVETEASDGTAIASITAAVNSEDATEGIAVPTAIGTAAGSKDTPPPPPPPRNHRGLWHHTQTKSHELENEIEDDMPGAQIACAPPKLSSIWAAATGSMFASMNSSAASASQMFSFDSKKKEVVVARPRPDLNPNVYEVEWPLVVASGLETLKL